MQKIKKITKVVNEKLNNNLFKMFIKKKTKIKIIDTSNKKGNFIDIKV